MAIKKQKDQPEQGLNVDPAVQAYLSGGAQAEVNARRVAAMGLSQAQRRKRARDAARSKATYDLPAELIARIDKVAAEYDVPKNQVAAFFLDHALRQYETGRVDLTPYLRPSRVPRFSQFLRLPEEPSDDWNLTNWPWNRGL